MRQYLAKLGLNVSEGKPATAKELTEIMTIVAEIHDQMLNDIILQPAAYGCAIGGLSLALDITLKTAAMVFEEWQRLHPPKYQDGGNITVVVIGAEEDEGG